jgi:O-antigen/teichoic acid export membrane protein
MNTDRSKQAGMLTTVEFIRFGLKSLVGILLARILVPAELGSYRQLFLIYSTFSTLLLLGIPQSVLYFLPKLRHIDSKREFISRTVNLVSALAFVFGLGIFLLRGFIARLFNNPQLELLLILYAVYPLFMFITQIYSQIMLGLKQPRKTAVFTLFSVATDFVLILGTALITKNLYYIVLALMVSALLQWGFAQFQLRHWLTKVSFDPGFYQEVFRYSLPLGLSSIIGMLSIQLDKLVPHISSEPAKMTEVYRAAVRKNALIIFPFAVLGLIFATPLITFLYTETYLGSVPFFRVYLLNLPLRVATYGIIFMALRKTRYIMINSLVTLGLNLVLNLVLVRLIGMMGAVIATVIVTWLSVALYLYWMRHKLGLDLTELFPLKALLKTLLDLWQGLGFSVCRAICVSGYVCCFGKTQQRHLAL